MISGEARLAFNEIGNRGGRADFGVRENRTFSFDVLSFRWPLDIQVNPELTYEEMKLKEVNKLFKVTQTGFEPRMIWLQIPCSYSLQNSSPETWTSTICALLAAYLNL